MGKTLQNYCNTVMLSSSSSSQQFCSENLPLISSLLNNPLSINETCPWSHLLHEKLMRHNESDSAPITSIFQADDDAPAMNPIYFSSNHNQSSSSSSSSSSLMFYENALGQTRPSDFRCDHLPECLITCTGPDSWLIENAAKDCSCMVEWFFNGYLIQLSFAILIFLLVNLSRILICEGLLHVFWRELTSPVFECQVYCDEQGRLLLPATVPVSPVKEETWRICCYSKSPSPTDEDINVVVGENGHSHGHSGGNNSVDSRKKQEEFIAESIRAKMTSFVRVGYAYLLLAVLLNVAWVYLIRQIAATIQYDPSLVN